MILKINVKCNSINTFQAKLFVVFLLSKYLKYLKGREFKLRCSLISVKEDKTSISNNSLMLIEI